ncbi:hypothetical protein BDR06DRAFT_974377 [Suillus hirtellus]|nr:hypothetical protein BDR06DRAFT_974377 [Suillus hirtellus]
MSSTPPSQSGTGNIYNLHQYHHQYPQLLAHHQQPFIQHYQQMLHVLQHYLPPLQYQYYPPHFIHQPLYQQYLPMRLVRMQPEVPAPEYPPAPELSQASSKAPASSQVSARLRPNSELCPGVFSFNINDDFKSHILAYLNAPEEVQLVYKFMGDDSKASHLNNAEAFGIAIDQLCHKVSNVCTQVVALEVKNAAAKQTTTKVKKRTCEDDIPPVTEEDSMQLKVYKQLECHIRCKLHHGHCFIDCTSGYDNHHHLNHTKMTLWAKKIALGHATIYNPPHCLNFDHGPANKKRHHLRLGLSPEVHVTIQNIMAKPTIASASQMQIPISKTLSPLLLPQQCPFESVPQISNTTLPDYPKIGVLLALIDAEKPELQIHELETSLLDAGVVLSSQVMLLPEDMLSVIGNMGQKQARILHNYAKQIVLPLLGLISSYEEPEIEEPEAFSAGTQNKGKKHAIEIEDDLWQEGELEYGSGEYNEYESDDQMEGGGEFLT